MGESIRIRTQLGINQTINVALEQDFEFLEILSLKIQQADIYTRSCANYGVIAGRITANNGFGIPNARVSVFLPVEAGDATNPIISALYPYTSPTDKNEDGYRYNLLPYEKSYSKHAATGTFPSRLDSLTDSVAIELVDKYYKYTVKTNESGDYMIMGAPLGTQTLVMDVDLSDIGEFSLTPQDLIRMGIATEAQVAGGQFKTSTDLNSLPQIISITKTLDVSPLWGDPELCQIAINRVDFDLRDDANIDIQPTAVFMGSMFSTGDKFRVRRNCRPKDNMGNLCDLSTGPGQILAIRQTLPQDTDGNPILEEYVLEQAGNVIDGSGTWLTELPMNLDYVITNEFGEKVISYDPTIGIPTKAKYRFKVKWQQSPTLTSQTRRAYYLVPNIKEYGWTDINSDPNEITNPNDIDYKKMQSSYYFGLDWSGYTNGFTGQSSIRRQNEIIACEDTFYEFKFNRVYTVAGLIDQYKKGSRGRFIGIKEIDDDSCSSTVNKFPTNDGFKNFDFLFFLFSIIMTIIQPTIYMLLLIFHPTLAVLSIIIDIFCFIFGICFLGICPFKKLRRLLPCRKNKFKIGLGMLTYPECTSCDCKQESGTERINLGDVQNVGAGGYLTYLSLPDTYFPKLEQLFSGSTDVTGETLINAEGIAGQALRGFISDPTVYKMPLSQNIRLDGGFYYHVSSKTLTLGERINVFNLRKNYFDGSNKIKVKVEPSVNTGSDKYHYDNTLTLLSNTQYNPGDLITMVQPGASTDVNWLYSANTINGEVFGISGMSYTTTAETDVNITYATSSNISQTVTYRLPYGAERTNYQFAADIEYFQVVTAITWSDIVNKWNPNQPESFPSILSATTSLQIWKEWRSLFGNKYELLSNNSIRAIDYVDDIENQYVLVLQRGVDPYSPKYVQQYNLGNLFGTGESDPNFILTAETRLNIPIQIDSSTNISVQDYNQGQMYFQSYFFKPGVDGNLQPGFSFSGYSTVNTGYYGLQNALGYYNPSFFQNPTKQVISSIGNGFYFASPSGAKYDVSEDLTGGGAMSCNNYPTYARITQHPYNNYLPYFNYNYYTKTIYGGVSWSAMTINDRVKNIMRTDRLPSSDSLDGGSWSINPSLLQQNLNFSMYIVDDSGQTVTTPGSTLGAQTVTPDIEGLPAAINVIESFSCEKMVGLKCYKGFGKNFEVDQNCTEKDSVEKGCYLLMRRPLLDLFKDIATFSEWSYRFRFFYALCRGVLSQSFMNNWVNGSLYAFPIQVDVFFNSQNKISRIRYCKDLIYYNAESVNFYYRSSPWLQNNNAPNYGNFIGKPPDSVRAVNDRNLLFPTTIVNLGMKDYFYSEITFDPDTKGYLIPSLNPTSYDDTSDLINLFVVSRITDNIFLKNLINFGDGAVDELFSRGNRGVLNNARRIDGDLAQLLSINSEIGVIKFSPEYYETIPGSTNDPVNILGTARKPIMAVWFSSNTENLQTKDYLTPGRIDFRDDITGSWFPYNYGIKSQMVPFYQWELDANQSGNPPQQLIFGSQFNDWKTNYSSNPNRRGIFSRQYQSVDRTSMTNPTFFQSVTAPNANDIYKRGYIFSVDANTNYSPYGAQSNVFQVGAPFHFYFGVIKGETALDRFKTQYSISE